MINFFKKILIIDCVWSHNVTMLCVVIFYYYFSKIKSLILLKWKSSSSSYKKTNKNKMNKSFQIYPMKIIKKKIKKKN